MSNRHHEAIEAYRKESPGFNSYIECMSRAYLTGLSGFAIGLASSYFGQKIFIKSLPYGSNGIILVSCAVASAVGFKLAANESVICQNAWMAQEGLHTALNPIKIPETDEDL